VKGTVTLDAGWSATGVTVNVWQCGCLTTSNTGFLTGSGPYTYDVIVSGLNSGASYNVVVEVLISNLSACPSTQTLATQPVTATAK
jgi:hypothetical protein